MLRSVPTLLSDVVTQGQGASAHSISPWSGQSFKVPWLGLVATVVLTGPCTCPMPCCLQQDSAILSCIPVTYCLLACGGQLSSSLQAGACVLVLQECTIVGGLLEESWLLSLGTPSLSDGAHTLNEWGRVMLVTEHPAPTVLTPTLTLSWCEGTVLYPLEEGEDSRKAFPMGSGAGNEPVGSAGGSRAPRLMESRSRM